MQELRALVAGASPARKCEPPRHQVEGKRMGGGSGGRVSPKELRALADAARAEIRSASGDGRRHVFISFAAEDIDAVNLLRGQAANSENELEFDDYSVHEPYESKDEDYIKRQIRARIQRASVTMVFLSKHAAASKWVDWEIRESIRQGKGVVGVYQGEKPPSIIPPALAEAKGKIVRWGHAELAAAIEAAASARTQ
jgi:hypothetical protein